MAPPRKVEARPSSLDALAVRVRAVSAARRGGDENELRIELRALADEASLLAKSFPLVADGGVGQRQADYLAKSHSVHSSC